MTDEPKGPASDREVDLRTTRSRSHLFQTGWEGGPGRPKLVPTEEEVRLAKHLARLGGTDREIAGALGRDISVIKRWMVEDEAFALACKVGGDMADNRVERSLFQRAVGGTRSGWKEAATKDGDVVVLEWEEEVLGDTAAASRWLEARNRKDWGMKATMTHEGDIEVRDSRSALEKLVGRHRDRQG